MRLPTLYAVEVCGLYALNAVLAAVALEPCFRGDLGQVGR